VETGYSCFSFPRGDGGSVVYLLAPKQNEGATMGDLLALVCTE
jgi:hypothetical protein